MKHTLGHIAAAVATGLLQVQPPGAGQPAVVPRHAGRAAAHGLPGRSYLCAGPAAGGLRPEPGCAGSALPGGPAVSPCCSLGGAVGWAPWLLAGRASSARVSGTGSALRCGLAEQATAGSGSARGNAPCWAAGWRGRRLPGSLRSGAPETEKQTVQWQLRHAFSHVHCALQSALGTLLAWPVGHAPHSQGGC